MLRFLADENLHGPLVRGLRLRSPDLDVVRVQDVGLMGKEDPEVLEWAAAAHRVVLTHDVLTMPRFAYDRVRAGQAMPGLVRISDRLPVGDAIEDVLILATCMEPEECEGQVLFLPLR